MAHNSSRIVIIFLKQMHKLNIKSIYNLYMTIDNMYNCIQHASKYCLLEILCSSGTDTCCVMDGLIQPQKKI